MSVAVRALDVNMFDSMEGELARFYANAANKLRQRMRTATATPYSQRRTELLLQQIDSITSALAHHQRGWCNRNLPRAYRRGLQLTAANFRMPVLPAMTLLDTASIEVIIARVMADTTQALSSVAPFARQVFLDTQQVLVDEKRLWGLIAEGRVEGLGPRELGKRIGATLQDGASARLKGFVPDALRTNLERTAKGEMITISCRDGVVRNYNLRSYGELVAQTATRQAATEAALTRTLESGGDLVQLSVHNGACPLCIPKQGKIYSITGRTEGFPLFTDAERIPLHPRCRHTVIGVNAEILEERGILAPMQEASVSDKPIRNVQQLQDVIGGKATSLGVGP